MRKEAAGEWFEALTWKLPSGSNEYHRNTSVSLAGLRAGSWTRGLPEYEGKGLSIWSWNLFWNDSVSSLYQRAQCHMYQRAQCHMYQRAQCHVYQRAQCHMYQRTQCHMYQRAQCHTYQRAQCHMYQCAQCHMYQRAQCHMYQRAQCHMFMNCRLLIFVQLLEWMLWSNLRYGR
jgi:hypothetical protein